MELITTFAGFSFFTLLYVLGYTKNDFVLEFAGDLGMILMGIIWFGTGLQIYAFAEGVFTFMTVPAGEAVGFAFFLFSALLGLYTWRTLSETRALLAKEGR